MGDQNPVSSVQVVKVTKTMDCKIDFHSLGNPRE